MQYRIEISEKAREQLRALPKDVRRNIGQRMEVMRDDLRGDVLKLRDKGNRCRLRIGTFRVLFVSSRKGDSGLCCQGSERSL